MLPWLQKLFAPFAPKPSPISVFQVEVTSRCQLKCTFCPNNVLGNKWHRGDMPWPLYRDSLLPHFSGADWVYLQGWGEPLLHPHLWDMFRLAKEKANQVGFTTNGMLLNPENARRLIDLQGDLIDISFSGNTATTHEALRRGSSFSQLKQNVSRLAGLKEQTGSTRPVIVLSYMLTKPAIEELPDFIDTAATLGANQVVAINLDYTPYPPQDELRVFSCSNKADSEYEARLQEANKRAGQRGLVFRRFSLNLDEEMLVCDARPLDTVFINHRGEMTPCTYLGLAVKGQIPRLFCGKPANVWPVSYGNIADGPAEVWNGPAASAFKRFFTRRQALAGPAAGFLQITGQGGVEAPAPPPQCANCYKLYKL